MLGSRLFAGRSMRQPSEWFEINGEQIADQPEEFWPEGIAASIDKPEAVNRPHPFLLIALTLLCCAVLSALAVAIAPKEPSRSEWRELLRLGTAEHTNGNSVACGAIGLDDSDTEAKDCVRESLAARREFWVLTEELSEDSIFWLLVSGDSTGLIQETSFDSLGWESRGTPSFMIKSRTCTDFQFSSSRPTDRRKYPRRIIWCVNG
jgi:hypothetical protein